MGSWTSSGSFMVTEINNEHWSSRISNKLQVSFLTRSRTLVEFQACLKPASVWRHFESICNTHEQHWDVNHFYKHFNSCHIAEFQKYNHVVRDSLISWNVSLIMHKLNTWPKFKHQSRGDADALQVGVFRKISVLTHPVNKLSSAKSRYQLKYHMKHNIKSL